MLGVYDLLTEAFVDPILLPQLQSSAPDVELVQRCFDFVESIVDHPEGTHSRCRVLPGSRAVPERRNLDRGLLPVHEGAYAEADAQDA